MHRHALDAPPSPPLRDLGSVLVVGGGLAAFQTVRALRLHGFDGRLTMLGAEGIAPYDRPPLSKQLFDRVEPAWLADDQRFDLTGAVDDLHLAEPALGLRVTEDTAEVTTASATYTADAVVLACGATARRPPGWDAALTLHTADDAARLRSELALGRRLVVIGAGWIGAELAGVARETGHAVTVLEASPTPLADTLGDRVGGRMRLWYDALGIKLMPRTRVAEVVPGRVLLADRRVVTGDVIVAAVGARPATSWLEGTVPLTENGSVRVDLGHRVVGLPPHVRAVGDCAERFSPRHGWVPGGHWDAALRGPENAVRDLLGIPATDDAALDPAPYVFSTQLGHELTLFGLPGVRDDVVLREDGASWTALYLAPKQPHSGGRELRAVLTVDRPRDVAAARRMFRSPVLPLVRPRIAADASRDLRDALSERSDGSR